MQKKSNVSSPFITFLCFIVFALTTISLTTGSFGGERGRRSNNSRMERQQVKRVERLNRNNKWVNKRRVISPRVIRYGHVAPRLPRGYKRVWHNKLPYFFRLGVFYRPGPSGYIVVKAPLGTIVVSLPAGHQRLWIDGSAYYVYGGTFYKRLPAGFVVVQPPDSVDVAEAGPDIARPAETATGEVSVIAPVLNVRSGPSLDDPKIYQIHEGYILEIHGRSNGWLYVELPNSEFGWIKSEFTRALEPASG